MATRPTITLDIRASNATWDTTAPVPLQGLNNKTPVPIASKIANGWNGNEKPGAQEWNFYDNRNDQWVFWVTEGSALALLSPHIKESDALGNTAFGSIVAGGTPLDAESISVTPNFGTGETGLFSLNGVNKPGAIFETNTNGTAAGLFRWIGTNIAETTAGILRIESLNDGPTALLIDADTTGPAIFISQSLPVGECILAFAGPGNDGSAEDGGPAFFGNVGIPDTSQVGGLAARFRNEQTSGDTVLIESVDANATGDCLVISGDGSSICIKATQIGGKRPAARFRAGSNGGDSSAPIQLVPQFDDITGDGLTDAEGSLWIKEGFFNGDVQHHPRFFSGASGIAQKWIPWTNGPTCAIDKFGGLKIGGDDDLFFDVFDGLQLDFDTDLIPLDTGVVIIRVSGTVRRLQNDADISAQNGALFQVFDLTADPGKASPIKEQAIDLVPINDGTTEHQLRVSWELNFEYTLPAAGQRLFLVEARRGTFPGPTTGQIETEVPVFHLKPRA